MVDSKLMGVFRRSRQLKLKSDKSLCSICWLFGIKIFLSGVKERKCSKISGT
jgi:hypothetical protein